MTTIEGLIWEERGTPINKRPEYPVKRLRGITTIGNKKVYYWVTWYGLTQIIGRQEGNKDIVDCVEEVRPEASWIIPHKTANPTIGEIEARKRFAEGKVN